MNDSKGLYDFEVFQNVVSNLLTNCFFYRNPSVPKGVPLRTVQTK
ncbi:hypothetical protein bpmyx0001_52780 [Bacillus pseudomycoides DSM 12442]|nr:hypothetical protein bpmyx0001_52780 [Bacillus pseudomycoides DSM 12442]